MISAFKFSKSLDVAMDRSPPFTCFNMVSSLALPKRFREGRGDSEPLLPLPPIVLQLLPPDAELLLPPSLCGNVFDFSYGRCGSLPFSG